MLVNSDWQLYKHKILNCFLCNGTFLLHSSALCLSPSGLLVLGISRVHFNVLRPQFESQTEVKEVSVHRHFVDESISLFLLYFIQLAVLAAYLNHDLLKLVPLLTIVFTFGR